MQILCAKPNTNKKHQDKYDCSSNSSSGQIVFKNKNRIKRDPRCERWSEYQEYV